MFRIIRFGAVLILLSVCLLPCSGLCAEPSDKTIIYGVVDWPPYCIINHDSTVAGIMPDILTSIASLHGYKVSFIKYPEKRGLVFLEEGKIDCWAEAVQWVSGPTRFIWTDPIVLAKDHLVFLKEKPCMFNRIEDLHGKNIVACFGYGYPTLEPYFSNGRIMRIDVQNELAMLKFLILRPSDAGVINLHNAKWLIRHDPQFQGRFAFSENAVASAECRFAFTKKQHWGEFIPVFNAELAKMNADGRLEKILEKYR